MIFTVGREDAYESYHRRFGYVNKGVGGSVWRTAKQARRHAPYGYAVYRVVADWTRHTAPSMEFGADWHDLLVPARILFPSVRAHK